jgi:hypothetical protein
MTRTHLHGVTILADATMAMVAWPKGKPRRMAIRTGDELTRAIHTAKRRFAADPIAVSQLADALHDAWESHIEEAWAALEVRTAEVS